MESLKLYTHHAADARNKYLLVKKEPDQWHEQIYGTHFSWCRVPRNWVNLCKVQILRAEGSTCSFFPQNENKYSLRI